MHIHASRWIVGLALTAGLACVEDTCIEERLPIALSDPGPWGATPAEVFFRAEGERLGTWTWLGGGELLDVSPATGEVAFTAELTFTADQAIAIDPTKRGSGRLYCLGAMEVTGNLTIQTDDGAINEMFEVVAVAEEATPDLVSVTVDLGQVDWQGAITIAASDGQALDESSLQLGVRWDTGSGDIEGELSYAGHSLARFTGVEL